MKRSLRQSLPSAVPFAFGVYGVLLVILTLFKNQLSLGGLWNTEAHQQRSLDLVLFNGFIDPPVWWGPWTNTFGNIGLFVPFGFFLYLILRARSSRFPFLETVLFAGLTSLGIEVLQWTFAVGYTDVDDLLFNTLGGVLGALVAFKAPRGAVNWLTMSITAVCLAVLVLIMASNLG